MKLQLSKDWSEFLRALISHRVKFVLIGGHAVAAWAEPRFTEDLDVLIEVSPPNARRVRRALADFGFGSVLPAAAFLEADKVWMLGRKPNRIDILTGIDGVTWKQVWNGRVRVDFAGGDLFVIGPDDLLANKRAAGRPKDLADADAIQRLARATTRGKGAAKATTKTRRKRRSAARPKGAHDRR
jgi:hypothetical protein